MKKNIIILLITVLAFVGIRVHFINRGKTTVLYRMSNGDKIEMGKILNTKYEDATLNGIEHWIIYAIEGELDWNNLPLTEHFKAKFKNGNEIMPEKNAYIRIVEGRTMKDNDVLILTLLGYHKASFFDFNNDNPIMTIYYYKYKMSENKKIDDIELLRKETVSATTGNAIN